MLKVGKTILIMTPAMLCKLHLKELKLLLKSSPQLLTIRHTKCDILEPSGKRCCTCDNHRKCLLVMVHRLESENTSTATDPSSHMNYRYLTYSANLVRTSL